MVEEGSPIPVVAEGRAKSATTTYLSVPGQTGGYDATQALTKDRIYYFPFYVRTPITIDQVAITVSVAAGASEKCRIAIYEADKNWQPGAQKVASAEIAIDAAAVVTTTLTSTNLQEGRYLIAVNVEGNATFRGQGYAQCHMGLATTLSTTPFIQAAYVAAAYAALPDPGTDWDTIDKGATDMVQLISLRVSTP